MKENLACALRCLLWVAIGFALALGIRTASAQIPEEALKYKRDLIRNARAEWGLDAPVSTFAAQVHQESAWRYDARSPVGAVGLSQFMPATARWITEIFPSLADGEPSNPAWALRAMVAYDRWLYDRVPPAATHCERMAFVLSSYNGGLGWLQRDALAARNGGADPTRWFANVERFNAGRADWAFRENRGYPRRILQNLEQRYRNAGWGIHSC